MKQEISKTSIGKFIEQADQMLKGYFVAYGLKTSEHLYYINIIIDDKDVQNMTKKELYKKLQAKLNQEARKISKKIIARAFLTSDINESNIWKLLGNSAKIMDVKSLTTFILINLPGKFKEAFENLPDEFRLSDFSKAITKITKKRYHRNTCQNWLRTAERMGFVKLIEKTYRKQKSPYKNSILRNL